MSWPMARSSAANAAHAPALSAPTSSSSTSARPTRSRAVAHTPAAIRASHCCRAARAPARRQRPQRCVAQPAPARTARARAPYGTRQAAMPQYARGWRAGFPLRLTQGSYWNSSIGSACMHGSTTSRRDHACRLPPADGGGHRSAQPASGTSRHGTMRVPPMRPGWSPP